MSNSISSRWCPLLLQAMIALCDLSAQAATTQLNPYSNPGNVQIPGSYPDLLFTVSDEHWEPMLYLQAGSSDGHIVRIVSRATRKTSIVMAHTDIAVGALKISSGDALKFVFDSSRQKWIYTASGYSPKTSGARIPGAYGEKIILYGVSNGDWLPVLTLPSGAPDGALVSIKSTATATARIAPDNIVFASSLNLRTNDRYLFSYRKDLGKWIPLVSPQDVISAAAAAYGMSAPSVPRTVVQASDSQWPARAITLPASAGDRDRIVVQSTASRPFGIDNSSIDFKGTLTVANGQHYEFLFVKEQNRWVLQSSPVAVIAQASLDDGRMPDQQTPKARYTLASGSGGAKVELPAVAKTGDQLVVKVDAASPLMVYAGSKLVSTVQPHETVRFVRDERNVWTRETTTITMLQVFSADAAARFGAAAMVIRLQEGLRLTNQALENSHVNFYLQSVGVLQRQLAGGTLPAVLDVGRSDPVIQKGRSALKADVVYYEGNETGCGLAWLNTTVVNRYMLAAGSTNCGPTVMRQEFGHTMGLNNSEASSGRTVYARGYARTSTVMGGNGTAYYSSPTIFSVDLGLPMGVSNQFDSVRALNEFSSHVAKVR